MNQQHIRDWRPTLLDKESSIHEAIKSLDKTGLQIVLVVDKSKRLIGTVTDGDVRRGILKGIEVNQGVMNIVNRDFLHVDSDATQKEILKLMKSRKLNQIPVLDASGEVIGMHFWSEIEAPSYTENLFVVMAGGKGLRLFPRTENCPKPMLKVAGKPILQHIVEHARDEGFTNFIFSIHYLGHMIEEYFGDGKKFNVNIEYLREDKPLGTAGALSLIKSDSKLPLLVTNGDVITDISYRQLLEFHKTNDATMTMAVRAHEWQNPFGVVTLQGIEVTGYLEKPISRSVTNAGVYVINRESLSVLVNHEYCDMPNFLNLVANSQSKIIAYPLHEEWIDVGRPEDFTLAHEWVARKESKSESNKSDLVSKETPGD